MKINFINYWPCDNESEDASCGHIAILNFSWQFDDYWKGIRIVIFNFAIEIGNN
jgi:hypothetical protein